MAARQRSFNVQHAPEWGIEPVPPSERRLGFLDQAVLWGNLGISLLVLVAGALLVPALGLVPALAATVVGAVVGNALLGLAAVPAAATGVPAMVLYRAPLGVRGSLLPTACNVVQNLGWATFELFVIASAATAISERVFGAGGRPLWVLAFGVVGTAMAVAGPLTVLRRWLQRFAVWAVLASTAYLSWYALTRFDLGALAGQAGQGGLSLPCPSPGCRWSPTTPASAARPAPPSGARPSATCWPRCGSSPSACCSCSPSARAT
jgi:nucleobase:cation symporter-1, NCS1 family